MNYDFKDTLDRKKTTIILAVIALVAGVGCVVFGELMLPIFSSVYAMLILVDSTNRRLASILIGAVATIAPFVLLAFGIWSLTPPFAVLIGFLIAWLFSRGTSKGELAVYTTVLILVLIIGTLYLSVAAAIGDFNPSAVIEYVYTEYVSVRDETVALMLESFEEVSPGLIEVLDETMLAEAFDAVFSLTFAILAITAFALAGFTFKIFSSLAYRFARAPEKIVYWRFSTSNIVAYFYAAVAVVSFFVGTEGVFAVTVNNLFYIFLAVFAYIGFNFALALMSRKLGVPVSVILIIAAISFLGILAFELLSVFGVIFTHINSKVNNVNNDSNT